MADTDCERVLDIYNHVLLALDAFEHRRLTVAGYTVAGARMHLHRVAASQVRVDVDLHHSAGPTMLRALVDFADVLGWTVLLPATGGGALLHRLGFSVAGDQLLRLPAPLAAIR
jgi:hypothetical protein